MSKRVQRYGSLAILVSMLILGLFAAGCVVISSINIGHHQSYDKKSVFEDTDFEQGYETQIGKGRK